MKDVIVGAITNYKFDHIKPWVNSLEASGFCGEKVMLCYNVDYETTGKLADRGFTILGHQRNDRLRKFEYLKPNFNICVERFLHLWDFLKPAKGKGRYRNIITTDVRDVVFQSNPSRWLETNIGAHSIVAASESIRYADEVWGRNNLLLSFGPQVSAAYQSRVISNAGVLAGKFDAMLDLFLNISLACGGAPANVPGGGGPDQAALNVLLGLSPYREITRFTASEEGWAAQLGTTVDPNKIDAYRPFLTEASPLLNADGKVVTSKGDIFAVVHQYDRVPAWKDIIESQYR